MLLLHACCCVKPVKEHIAGRAAAVLHFAAALCNAAGHAASGEEAV
jgi:hypothetical protein